MNHSDVEFRDVDRCMTGLRRKLKSSSQSSSDGELIHHTLRIASNRPAFLKELGLRKFTEGRHSKTPTC